jgi:hypothetical protein
MPTPPSDEEARAARAKALREQVRQVTAGKPRPAGKQPSPRTLINQEMAKRRKKLDA